MVRKLTKEEFISLAKQTQASKKARKEIENQAKANQKYESDHIPYYDNKRNGTW